MMNFMDNVKNVLIRTCSARDQVEDEHMLEVAAPVFNRQASYDIRAPAFKLDSEEECKDVEMIDTNEQPAAAAV